MKTDVILVKVFTLHTGYQNGHLFSRANMYIPAVLCAKLRFYRGGSGVPAVRHAEPWTAVRGRGGPEAEGKLLAVTTL